MTFWEVKLGNLSFVSQAGQDHHHCTPQKNTLRSPVVAGHLAPGRFQPPAASSGADSKPGGTSPPDDASKLHDFLPSSC